MRQAEADVRGADAGIRGAQAGLAEARVSLEHTVIRSPIDGVVIGRHVDVGQTIAARVNAPVLFTLGDLRRMRLLADVPEVRSAACGRVLRCASRSSRSASERSREPSPKCVSAPH